MWFALASMVEAVHDLSSLCFDVSLSSSACKYDDHEILLTIQRMIRANKLALVKVLEKDKLLVAHDVLELQKLDAVLSLALNARELKSHKSIQEGR